MLIDIDEIDSSPESMKTRIQWVEKLQVGFWRSTFTDLNTVPPLFITVVKIWTHYALCWVCILVLEAAALNFVLFFPLLKPFDKIRKNALGKSWCLKCGLQLIFNLLSPFFLLQYDYEYDENGDRVVLGKGTYGIVYAGRDMSNQVRIAIKEIPERDSRYSNCD